MFKAVFKLYRIGVILTPITLDFGEFKGIGPLGVHEPAVVLQDGRDGHTSLF